MSATQQTPAALPLKKGIVKQVSEKMWKITQGYIFFWLFSLSANSTNEIHL